MLGVCRRDTQSEHISGGRVVNRTPGRGSVCAAVVRLSHRAPIQEVPKQEHPAIAARLAELCLKNEEANYGVRRQRVRTTDDCQRGGGQR